MVYEWYVNLITDKYICLLKLILVSGASNAPRQSDLEILSNTS